MNTGENNRLSGYPLPAEMTFGLLLTVLAWFVCILQPANTQQHPAILSVLKKSAPMTQLRQPSMLPELDRTAKIHINRLVFVEKSSIVELSTKSESKPAKNRNEHRFHGMIVKAAEKNNLDPALIKAIVKAESGYNHRAVSKRGAVGLMQLMPGTAEELGLKDGFDPENNINAGVRYFKGLMDRFDGDVSLALAAYNAGSKNVRIHQGVPPFKSTRYYIKKVFKYYQVYKDQMAKDVNNA